MKRQQNTPGAIVEIPINEGEYYAYAQILTKASFAFFDYRCKDHLKDFTILQDAPVLFITSVYKDIVSQGVWPKIGKLPIAERFVPMPMRFIYDDSLDRYSLYDPNTGEITRSDKESCRGLERCAVWDAHHIQDRISDHYANRPCKWMSEDYKQFED